MLNIRSGDIERSIEIGSVATIGRGAAAVVRVEGATAMRARYVSKVHLQVAWDGSRWRTRNVSTKPHRAQVYEPGFEDIPLEPGRDWSPVRHRWAYALGHPADPVHVVCTSDDHAPAGAGWPAATDTADDPTAELSTSLTMHFTTLELEVIRAYYGTFGALPRPAVLEPRPHLDAARRLRSVDSGRKAIERINQKLSQIPGAPPAASGRNVSAEIGRWLARQGLLDPDASSRD